MAHSSEVTFVGVDWGTTHRRAYALDRQSQCLRSHADGEGALASKGRFAQALDAALQALDAAPRHILLSGMAGSAMGWQEAPYLDASVALQDIPKHLVAVRDAASTSTPWLVPGYCIRDASGKPDVMRGEETQLLGAVMLGYASGWFVLPGTHSKWVQLEAGRILQLRTYMTGELFDLLGKQGTLAAAAGSGPQVWDAEAFAQGVQAARHGALGHLLFSARARVVCGDMPAERVRAYLSGMLIGHELHDIARDLGTGAAAHRLHLIGSPELALHYQSAAAILDCTLERMDAQDTYLAALAHFQTHWNPA